MGVEATSAVTSIQDLQTEFPATGSATSGHKIILQSYGSHLQSKFLYFHSWKICTARLQ